ncbi:hypothetical protein KBB96_04540 [Luteolibacter ambystomatis]|uniref:Uncharacterized protein n=1 Tax=Luteolibacter ambystomatis TaxID=2824561 RepID=A0A975J184_9BACT|nr:hypothetical protein [Luteolibacter ambystomatis]QUE52162.1 hypothetical protein KBB96_04540 [Luteolibacter ambystomatis]
MKTSFLTALAAALLAGGHALAQTNDPAIPVGSLTAFPTIVQTGTHPTLTWNITYPSIVQDVVTITPPGILTPKQDLYMDVRILGASVATSTAYFPVEAQVKYDTGSWTRVFYDKQTKVNPSTIVYTRQVLKNKQINFAGRYYYNNAWSTLYTTLQGNTGQIVALVNGATPPSTFPDYNQPTIESFLRPYLDSAGKIKIGPMDVIYLFELTHTNTNDSGFDLQDLCVLVTFRKS